MDTIVRTTDIFDNFLTKFFGDDMYNTSLRKDSIGSVNIKEDESNYELEVFVPSFKKDDIDIKIENNILTISGNKKLEKEEKTENYLRKEFSSSTFTRNFDISKEVDTENIEAEMSDGILKLKLKKNPEISNVKQIEIK